jgi:predicted PurR-regulated permease PerM
MTAAPQQAPTLVPTWLSNLAGLGWRILVILALAALAIALAVQMATVTATLIVSACIVAAVAPLVADRRARGWSRAKSAAYASGVAALVVVGALAFAAIAFLPYVPDLIAGLEAAIARVAGQLQQASVPPEAIDATTSVVSGAVNWLSSSLGGIVGGVAMTVTVLILTAFLVFYLLLDGDKGWDAIVQSVEGWRRDVLRNGAETAVDRLGSYVRGTSLLAAINAAAAFAMVTVLGLPFAGPLAVLVLIGGLVPYIGLVLATGAMVLVALANDAPTKALVLIIGVVVVNLVGDRYVVPRLIGQRVKVHPGVALVAIPVAAAVAGLFGVVFAVPVMVPIVAASGSIVAVLKPQNPSPEIGGIVPTWLDRVAQWSWRLLIVLGVVLAGIVIIGQAPVIILPLILAAVLAPSCLPVVRWLEGHGVKRQPASLAVVLGATLIAGALLWLTYVALTGQLSQIVSTAVSGAITANKATGGRVAAIAPLVQAFGPELVRVVGLVAGAAAAAFIGIVLIGLVLSYYLLIDGARGWAYATSRLSTWRRRRLDDTAERAVGVLGGYMFGTAIVSGFGALSQWALMTILGLPLALPVAILSFFACFIPYIGGFITTGLAFLIAVAVGTPFDIVVMGVFTVVFNIVQGNVLQPLVYGKVASLHPAVVLMAIPAAASVAGILGMFLVVPVLGVVSVSWRAILDSFGNEETIQPEPTPATAPADTLPAGAPLADALPADALPADASPPAPVPRSVPATEHQTGRGA